MFPKHIPDVASKRSGTKVWTPTFKGGFVNLLKPKAIPGTDGEPQYSMLMLFDTDSDLTKLKEAAVEAAKDKWGDNAAKIRKNPKFKDPFKNQADMVDKNGDLYSGMVDGAICVQAQCKQSFGQPQVVDTDQKDLIDARDIYSGAYYRATINAYAWDHSVGGKGVSFGLSNVQKLADGEKLGGGRSNIEDDFEPIETSGGEDDEPAWDDAA